MNRSRRSLFTLILALALFFTVSGYAHAQENKSAPNKSAPNKEETAALREKAFKLIDSVAGQLGTLQSAENRARMVQTSSSRSGNTTKNERAHCCV